LAHQVPQPLCPRVGCVGKVIEKVELQIVAGLIARDEFTGGVRLLGQFGHDVSGFGQARVIAGDVCIGVEKLGKDLVEPHEPWVVELGEFAGNSLGDAVGPAGRQQDPSVSFALHHPSRRADLTEPVEVEHHRRLAQD
jgi:hypothetical protein